MHLRKSSRARWYGTASEGRGALDVGGGEVSLPFTLRTRTGEQPATNPEELLGSALAGCFAMSLANLCEERDARPDSIEATATVHLVQGDEGFRIPSIDLACTVRVDGLEPDALRALAEEAERTCPVRLLYDAEVTLTVEIAP